MVVRPQRGGLLPDHALPGADVLLPAQSGQPAHLLVPPLHHPLLGADLYLYLGGPAPPALHRLARLGAVAGRGVFGDAARAELGRDDQRPADPAGRLGQSRFLAGAQVYGGGDHHLRHGRV